MKPQLINKRWRNTTGDVLSLVDLSKESRAVLAGVVQVHLAHVEHWWGWRTSGRRWRRSTTYHDITRLVIIVKYNGGINLPAGAAGADFPAQTRPVVWCCLMNCCSPVRVCTHPCTHSTCTLSLKLIIVLFLFLETWKIKRSIFFNRTRLFRIVGIIVGSFGDLKVIQSVQ